jgi:hypothetical protein
MQQLHDRIIRDPIFRDSQSNGPTYPPEMIRMAIDEAYRLLNHPIFETGVIERSLLLATIYCTLFQRVHLATCMHLRRLCRCESSIPVYMKRLRTKIAECNLDGDLKVRLHYADGCYAPSALEARTRGDGADWVIEPTQTFRLRMYSLRGCNALIARALASGADVTILTRNLDWVLRDQLALAEIKACTSPVLLDIRLQTIEPEEVPNRTDVSLLGSRIADVECNVLHIRVSAVAPNDDGVTIVRLRDDMLFRPSDDCGFYLYPVGSLGGFFNLAAAAIDRAIARAEEGEKCHG